MVCRDCNQRKKSIAVLNSALVTESRVFMSTTESRCLEIAIGSLESVEQLCRERQVDSKGRDINVKSVIREYKKLEGTQHHYAQKTFSLNLRRETRDKLPERNVVIVADFGQSITVGQSSVNFSLLNEISAL